MKKISIILTLAVLISVSANTEASAQCKQQMVYDCATQATQAIYLRDFNTKLKRVKKGSESGTKWTVVLNRGTKYRFNVCTPSGYEEKVVLKLYDSQHPEVKPHLSTEGSLAMDFICRKSGMYYVSIRFKEGQGAKKTCAVGILSFVGKNKSK